MDFREEDGKAVLVNPLSLSIPQPFLLMLSASFVPPPLPLDP